MANKDIVNFCPRCGKPVVSETRSGRLRPVCPACGWIHFSDPKVAVAAVLLQGEDVLLIRRAQDPRRGLWTLPAGFVDSDEDPGRAAERECLEETGLHVHATGVLDVIAGREHPRGADILIVYTVMPIGGNLLAGDDADQAAFFSVRDLPPLAFEATRRVMARLQSNHLT
ncbi:MAG: NUDIX hydrolase [Chloroflexi bacterium]|nr:NUDIX hydrolase [Chloroflexota bacterium]